MKITNLGSKSAVTSEKKQITSKKDFSQNFNFARDRKSEEQLKEILDNIKKRGNRLVITKSYADVRGYKEMIKNYLESVLKHMYEIKKDISFWQTQYFITVETIDARLEDLTQMLLSAEVGNLDVASTIDDITGLVLDIYK